MSGSPTGLRVVVAPDKFKGSLSAIEVVDILASELLRALPDATVLRHPVADGGEGTVRLALSSGFAPVTVQVAGPLGDPVEATYARRGQVVIIEMASAAGLGLLPGPPNRASAAAAGTRGVGELIGDALDRGVRRIVVGMGGSASTDGGAGLVQALGAVITGAVGDEIAPGGPGLQHASSLDLSGLDNRLQEVDLVIACDVDNPLLGPEGAAQVYGPQKGADPSLVAELDGALAVWADLVAGACGLDRRDEPGAGAAGGAAFGAVSVLGARLVPGVETLMELSGFGEDVAGADLVIVGEGSLDEQSLRGKGPIGVAALSRARGARVVAVVGRNLLDESQTRAAGLDAVYALSDIEPRVEVSIRDAGRLLRVLAADLVRDLRDG